jgi:hypothetical protein
MPADPASRLRPAFGIELARDPAGLAGAGCVMPVLLAGRSPWWSDSGSLGARLLFVRRHPLPPLAR